MGDLAERMRALAARVQEEKKMFVEEYLRPCLCAADEDIISVEYIAKSVGGREVVKVTYMGGTFKVANVTGDSHTAILKDVCKQIL